MIDPETNKLSLSMGYKHNWDEQIAADLKARLAQVPAKDQTFAKSLTEKWDKYSNWTPKQFYWGLKMLAAINPPPPPRPVSIGDFSAVIALFKKASEKLKHPAIILEVVDTKLKLYVSGPKSKAPGTVQVVVGWGQDNDWLGRVDINGQWTAGAKAQAYPMLEDFLTEFAADPATMAAAFGHQTGKCCFCALPLTDPKSLAAGFGPTCASHYGLKDQWKAAASK